MGMPRNLIKFAMECDLNIYTGSVEIWCAGSFSSLGLLLLLLLLFLFLSFFITFLLSFLFNSTSSPSRGGDVAVYVFDLHQPSLPIPFHSVLVSVSVFMDLSTVFHSIKFPTTLRFLILFFRSYFCLTDPFNYISLHESLSHPLVKAPTD